MEHDSRDIRRLLGRHEIRPTKIRMAIAGLLFDGLDKHVTVDDVIALARARDIKTSVASVYNTLNYFAAAGLLRRVTVEQGRAFFDTNLSAHHHFYFEDEGRLEDIPAGALQISGLPKLPKGREIKSVDVTIRLNFDTGYTEPWSRFGFNIESGQAMDAARILGESNHLQLTGLHSHLGTFVLDPRAYGSQVRIMCAFMEQIEAATACLIESIDIGGGFASMNSLQGSYLPPEQVVPSIDQYAEAICFALNDATRQRELSGKPRPRLILESGRFTVDDTEILVTSAVANKRMPDGRRSVVLDAGVNILFTGFWYNHPVTPIRPLDGVAEDTILYGPLCMNIDIVRSSVMLPPMNVGDALVFSHVGAYNNTQWMQFIEYRPNVIMIHEDGNVSVIREAEDLQVMTAQERIPEHLQSIDVKG